MKWDFTTKQVLSGEVDYSVEDFQKDLKKEAELNFQTPTKKEARRGISLNDFYSFLYGVCYLSAIEKKPPEINAMMGKQPTPEANKIIEGMQASQKENIDMVRAILMRQYLRIKFEFGGGLSDENTLKLHNAYLSESNKDFLNWAWNNFSDKK